MCSSWPTVPRRLARVVRPPEKPWAASIESPTPTAKSTSVKTGPTASTTLVVQAVNSFRKTSPKKNGSHSRSRRIFFGNLIQPPLKNSVKRKSSSSISSTRTIHLLGITNGQSARIEHRPNPAFNSDPTARCHRAPGQGWISALHPTSGRGWAG